MHAVPGVGDTFGRYLLERELGRGGMGVVFLALDTQLQRRVALKVVSADLAHDPSFRARFHSEAEILTQLDSPHVTTTFEHGEIDGIHFLAMQYVPGGDLGTLMRTRGPLPVHLAAAVTDQVAQALADAHRSGIVHRDVKPGNVLLRDPEASEPFAYLGDFGLAKSTTRPEGDGATRIGSVAGSWGYMAPERLRGGAATASSDIYALGCLFHACLTGRAPFRGSDVEVALAHAEQPVPQWPGDDPLTQAVNRVLARSMAKQAEDRHPSVEAVRSDLAEVTRLAREGGSGIDPAGPVPGPSGPSGAAGSAASHPSGAGHPLPPAGAPAPVASGSSPRRGRLVAAVVAGVLVVGAAVGVAAWQFRGDDDPETKKPTAPPAQVTPGGEGQVTGDWNGDGRGDVRIGRRYFDDGFFPLPQQLWTTTAEGTMEGPAEDMGRVDTTYSGDVDGDGRLDLVEVVESEDEKTITVRTHPGTDDGPGEPRQVELSASSDINSEASYALGDFDGDGMDDLLVPVHRQEGYLTLQVARSTGDSFATPDDFGWRSGKDNTGDQLVVGDFDGDGNDDVVATVANKNTMGLRFRTFLSDGTKFVRPDVTPRIEDGRYSNELSDFVAADVDGDGADELVAMIHMNLADEDAGYGHGLVVMELSNGSFVTPQEWSVPTTAIDGYTKPAIGASDVDGDGRDDIVQITDLDTEDEKFDLVTFRSTGTEFEDAVTVASPPCLRTDCTEAPTVVTNRW